jgi:Putative heavy-metal-binding
MESAPKVDGLNLMQVSFAAALDGGRRTVPIGRIRATAPWRAAIGPSVEADRQTAVEALRREAEEYGADAIIDVQFEIDACKGYDVDGVRLQRVTATGLAVRIAQAA